MDKMTGRKLMDKISRTYSSQKERCYSENCTIYKWYGAKGVKVEYSKNEFKDWYLKEYRKFNGVFPSIGRIDHEKNYRLDNIEMVSKSENSKERHKRVGPTMERRAVWAVDTETMNVRLYESITAASKETKYNHSTIQRHIDKHYQNTETKIYFVEA